MDRRLRRDARVKPEHDTVFLRHIGDGSFCVIVTNMDRRLHRRRSRVALLLAITHGNALTCIAGMLGSRNAKRSLIPSASPSMTIMVPHITSHSPHAITQKHRDLRLGVSTYSLFFRSIISQ
jgi:hypothetical protein